MQESLELAYNTDNNNLIIPEYGRNVHRMVQHAMTISDKNERNKCAETIVKIMDLINPNSKKNSNAEEYQQKLWSQLFIISNFQLDVDSPYGAPKIDQYKSRPESVPYPSHDIKYGHYGKIMEDMIKAAAEKQREEQEFKAAVRAVYDRPKLTKQVKKAKHLSPGGLDCFKEENMYYTERETQDYLAGSSYMETYNSMKDDWD